MTKGSCCCGHGSERTSAQLCAMYSYEVLEQVLKSLRLEYNVPFQGHLEAVE